MLKIVELNKLHDYIFCNRKFDHHITEQYNNLRIRDINRDIYTNMAHRNRSFINKYQITLRT